MTNYTKTTDFAAKDSLPSGDSGKIIRGTEFETEFDNIATAVNSKSDANNPTFTGTVTIDGLTVNGNTVLGNAATDTVTVTADIASNLLPSADDTYNLGAVGAEWNDLFIDGVANIDSLVANTADINGGTVDGVTIGGSSAGAITGTTITGTSFVTSGDMTFGDNDKAIFGAGSDLQIYHSGSYSVIEDSGTGNLFIKGSNLSLRDADGNDFITMVDGGAGGTVSLLHLGSPKLATTLTGINVNGSVSADGLTVDGSSSGDITLTGASASNTGLFVRDPTATAYGAFFGYDDANTVVSIGGVTNGTKNTAIVIGRDSNYVGIGTDSPNRELTIGDGTSSPNIRLLATTAGNSKIEFGDTDNGDVGQIQYVHSADYMQFTTAGAERLRIDASGRVGINTSAQDRTLHVRGSVTFESTTGNGAFLFVPTDTVNRIYSRAGNQSTTALPIAFNQGSAEAMRIDSSGNVGIGGSTPSEKLEVSNGSAADSGEISIKLGGDVDNNARTMTITKDTSTPYNTIINTQNNTGVNTGSLIFKNGATEQMRIDSSGNVLVGKTSVNQFTTVGHELHEDGLVVSTRDSGNVAVLNRETNDGSIIQFRKDNSTVGTISAATTNIIYGNNTRGIKIEDALIIPRNVNDTNADDQVDLGSSTSRWKDLHLSGTAYSDKIQINNTTQLDTTAALEVNNAEGSGYARITLNDTDGNNQRTYFEQSNGLTRISTQNGSNYGDFVISAWNGSQTRNSLYVDNVNHKIGLGGDTTPEKHLTVNFNSTETDVFASGLPGGASGQGVLIRNENTTGSTYANLDFRAGTVDARIATQYSGSSNQGKMLFIMDKDGSAPATMLTLNADGGVAIGGSESDHGYQACIHGNLWVKSADGTHNAISIGELADNSNSPLYQIGTDDDNGDELRIETARWGHRTSWYRGSPSGPDIESIRLSSTADGTDSGSMLSLYRQDDYSTSTAVSNLIHLSTMGNSYINSGHNVGIGTSSPSDKLDVHGTIYARGGTFQGATSDAPTDTAMVIDVNNAIMFSTGTNVRNLIRNGASDSTIIEVGQNFTSLIDNIDLIPGSSGNVRFKTSNGDTKAYVNSGGDVVATRHQIAKNQAGTYVFDDTITANTQEDIFSVQCTRGAMAMTVYMVCNTNNMSVAKTYQVVKASGSAPVVTLIADTGAFGSHDFEATFSQGVNDTTMVCEIDNDSTTINAEITTTVVMGGSPTTITVTEL